MNQQKTGSFLKELRKEKNLTPVQLPEQITIKEENGRQLRSRTDFTHLLHRIGCDKWL